MSSLLERMKKAGSIELAETLDQSKFFGKKDMIPTQIPMLNVALSGSINGGLTPGLTFLAGPSRHFKSMFGLIMVKAYLDKYPESICLFMDSEFGITPDYIKNIGIDTSRVLHIPIEHVEQLKFDLVQRLKEVKRGDKVIVFIDSIGNLASKKEVEDAENEKSVADMTRAKQIKSLFRIITPHFTTKDIPCVVVNHIYMEQTMFPKAIMSGGTGPMYSANQVFIIGRQQDKEGTEIAGYHFIINVEKSRYVKEKSKIPITVSYEGGVNQWSGLLDVAVEGGYIFKPKVGWYCVMDKDTGEAEGKNYRANDIIDNKEFWLKMFKETDFAEYIKSKYSLETSMSQENVEDEDDE